MKNEGLKKGKNLKYSGLILDPIGIGIAILRKE